MKKILFVILFISLISSIVLASSKKDYEIEKYEEVSEIEEVYDTNNQQSNRENTQNSQSTKSSHFTSFVLKIGSALAPKATMTIDSTKESEDKEKFSAIKGPAFSASLEFLTYDIIGIGLSYVDMVNFKDIRPKYNEYKIGFVDAYMTIQPRIYKGKLLQLYPIIHVGASFPFVNKELSSSAYMKNHTINLTEFYWGVGVGAEVKGFLVEIMYAVNYFREFIKYYDGTTEDNINSCAAYRFNIGYRFKL